MDFIWFWRRKENSVEIDERRRKMLEIAIEGKDVWNKWRNSNPNELIDFSHLDFTQTNFNGLNLASIDFSGFIFGSNVKFDNAKFGLGYKQN